MRFRAAKVKFYSPQEFELESWAVLEKDLLRSIKVEAGVEGLSSGDKSQSQPEGMMGNVAS